MKKNFENILKICSGNVHGCAKKENKSGILWEFLTGIICSTCLEYYANVLQTHDKNMGIL